MDQGLSRTRAGDGGTSCIGHIFPEADGISNGHVDAGTRI